MNNSRARNAVLVAALAAVFIFVACYTLSPFLALHALRNAVHDKDRDALSAQIDFPAVRQSLKDQFSAVLTEKVTSDKTLRNNPFAGLVAGLASVVVDKAVDSLITPDALAAMLARPMMVEKEDPNEHQRKEKWDWNWSFVDLDHLKIDYAKRVDPVTKFSLLFERRGLFNWQVTRLDLPLDEIMKRSPRDQEP